MDSRKKTKIIWLTPSGKQFTNAKGKQYAKKHSDIIIVCGRYEGIDARVNLKINEPEGGSRPPRPAMKSVDEAMDDLKI
jgi:tRNA (guanine-N1)-methyltransferase